MHGPNTWSAYDTNTAMYTAVFMARVHGRRRPVHGLYMAEAEAKADAKVIVTRTIFVATWPSEPQERGQSQRRPVMGRRQGPGQGYSHDAKASCYEDEAKAED